MPKEYIEREALIEVFRRIEKDKTDCFSPFANTLIDFIKLVPPTADVVEVVRCKDCKHFLNDTDYCKEHNKGYCEWDNAIKNKSHFCSLGKRGD